ncbi:DNA-directed RNA polymerase II subunit GRINL1A [Periplaneta americana]|uniref:DNA-directed RNA polymerase II subunit GRINL1A n=1 Tax=Periplaneta americana TaxID=6978 RepID=UPI0037E760BE
MLHKKIIKRIPGNLLEPSPREKQGFIEDLGQKSKAELLELIERQDKLLENKSFVAKLPDKGERITAFRSRLLEELAQRDEIGKTCRLLSGLEIGKPSFSDEIEWTGKYSGTGTNNKAALDSDDESDDERNPLKILATQSGIGTYEKQCKVEEPEKSLITQEDLKDIEAIASDGVAKPKDDVYIKHLCDKIEKPREKKREQFKPFRNTKTENTQHKKPLGPHWEVTAATPPLPVHGDVKLISLQESLQLQKEQAAKLKDVQAKHAAERLASQLGVKMGSTLPDSALRMMYRDEPHHSDSSSNSEDEMANSDVEHEDEELEKDGAIIYNIVD